MRITIDRPHTHTHTHTTANVDVTGHLIENLFRIFNSEYSKEEKCHGKKQMRLNENFSTKKKKMS